MLIFAYPVAVAKRPIFYFGAPFSGRVEAIIRKLKPRTLGNQSLNRGLCLGANTREQEITEPLPAPKDFVPHIADDSPLDAFITHSVSFVVFLAAWRGRTAECPGRGWNWWKCLMLLGISLPCMHAPMA